MVSHRGSSVQFVECQRALADWNGREAKAAYTYTSFPPFSKEFLLNLKPLERMSITTPCALSASLVFGSILLPATLCGSRVVS